MGAVGRMVGGGEVVQAIVTSAFPILRLDTVPLVALAVAGCCLLLLWVILRWRQEPQMPELRETCSVLRAAYCPCLHPSPHPHPTSLDRFLYTFTSREKERFHCHLHMSHLQPTVRQPTAHPGIAASVKTFSQSEQVLDRKS